MALSIQRKGYGQVEPNHLSAQYTGQIYAQLPAMTVSGNTKTPIAQLENGQFLKYNYKDFCMKANEMSDKTIYPRLLKTNIGDIFTTNTIGAAATGPDDDQASAVSLSVGDKLVINNNGFLVKAGENPTGIIFQVVKEYDLADKQAAVKIQRIQ